LRLALSKELVKAILEGAAPITSDLSAMLEKLFDVPARFWNNRERRYREHLAQQNSAIPPQPRLRGASGA
jgi:plasmid maintenance system antidote protein VapI